MKRAPRSPGILTCLATLAWLNACTRLLGLRRTFSLVRRLTSGITPVESEALLVSETTRRLILVSAFYPRRAQCLEQSLALYVLLRRRGVAAELKLGVQPLPFYAHAWVEVNGRAVDEHGGLPLQLATFAGLEV